MQNAKVGQKLPMRGTAPAGQPIWLVVHPQGTPDYLVQPPASANGEGQWKNVAWPEAQVQSEILQVKRQ